MCLKQATLSRQDAVIKTGEPKKKEVFKTNLKIDFLRARAGQIVKIVIHIAALRLKISSGLSARGGFIFAQYATHLLSPGVNTLTYFALRTKNIHPKRFPVFSCSRANHT